MLCRSTSLVQHSAFKPSASARLSCQPHFCQCLAAANRFRQREHDPGQLTFVATPPCSWRLRQRAPSPWCSAQAPGPHAAAPGVLGSQSRSCCWHQKPRCFLHAGQAFRCTGSAHCKRAGNTQIRCGHSHPQQTLATSITASLRGLLTEVQDAVAWEGLCRLA